MRLGHGVVAAWPERPATQQSPNGQNRAPTRPVKLNRLLGIDRTARKKPARRKAIGERPLIPINRPQHQFFHRKPLIFRLFAHTAQATNRPLDPIRRTTTLSHPRRHLPDKTPAEFASIWHETTRVAVGAKGFVARPRRPADPRHRRWLVGPNHDRSTCCTKEFPSEHMCPLPEVGERSVASECD